MPLPRSHTDADAPPNAARFIVTVYGDIVEPRGGVLWMGSLISICALVGISESLVRTSVSRLVASGRLEGRRQGRRSFYSLTKAGAVEFARASELIFGGAGPAEGWALFHAPDAEAAHALEKAGAARIGPEHLIAPDTAETGAAPIMRCTGTGELSGWARNLWPLGELAGGYREFLKARRGDRPAEALDPAQVLAARLMLVHDWRRLVLADPRLPASALPGDWPGPAAAAGFARRYLALEPAAETAVAGLCETLGGAALAPGPAVGTRRAWLRRLAG